MQLGDAVGERDEEVGSERVGSDVMKQPQFALVGGGQSWISGCFFKWKKQRGPGTGCPIPEEVDVVLWDVVR